MIFLTRNLVHLYYEVIIISETVMDISSRFKWFSYAERGIKTFIIKFTLVAIF